MKHIVYRLLDAQGDTIYIGVSCDIRRRMAEHGSKSWFAQVDRLLCEEFESRNEALARERALIQTEEPKHNAIRYLPKRKKPSYRSKHPKLHFVLPPDVRARLEEYITTATARFYPAKLTMNAVISAALGEYLDRHESDVSPGQGGDA